MVNLNAKQKHPGCKKGARPIRSSPTYVQPKSFISTSWPQLISKILVTHR